MVGVGHYVRQLILERHLMPGNDFDWEGTSKTDPILKQFIKKEGDIYRLLDPEAKFYNNMFKTEWLEMLDLAIEDMGPNGDATTDASGSESEEGTDYAVIPSVPDLTKLAEKIVASEGS